MGKVFSLSKSFSSITAIIFSLLVGILLEIDLIYFYLAAGFIFLIMGFISLICFEDNVGSIEENNSYTIKAFKTFIHEPIYIFLSIVLASAFSSYSIFILVWQNKAIKLEGIEGNLPFLYAFYLIGTAIAGFIYGKKYINMDVYKYITVLFLIMSISYILMYFSENIYLYVFGLFIYGLGFGSILPIFFTWSSSIIDNSQYVSLLSLMNAVSSFASVITNIIVGKIINSYTINIGMIIAGVLSFASCMIIVFIKRKDINILDMIN